MTDQTPLQQAAEELHDAFERRTRDDGESFTTLKDGSPDWCLDAVRDAHGDLLPNDWSYSTAQNVASGIVDGIDEDTDADDLDDLSGDICDGEVDVYNAARTAWLASNLSRAFFCDEAREEGLVSAETDIFDRIGIGQYMEARQIFGALATAIKERAEEIEAERDEAEAEAEERA